MVENDEEHFRGVYYMLHKPPLVLSSTTDNTKLKRQTLYDIARQNEFACVGHVGRLDYETSGLMVMTNDVELSIALTSRDFAVSCGATGVVEKTYNLTVAGLLVDDDRRVLQLSEPLFYPGVGDHGVWTRPPVSVRVIKSWQVQGAGTVENEHLPFGGWLTMIEVILSEGRNRQIRRLCKRSKLYLRLLHRVGFAGLHLGELKEGSCRALSSHEVFALYALAIPHRSPHMPGPLMPVAAEASEPHCVVGCVASSEPSLSPLMPTPAAPAAAEEAITIIATASATTTTGCAGAAVPVDDGVAVFPPPPPWE